MADPVTADLLSRLRELGAGDFAHLDGTLEAHLRGTHALLVDWGADEVLQRAGLFHAAYGTAEFNVAMVSLDRRAAIAHVIGAEAEAVVYVYCACDRPSVWPTIGIDLGDEARFRDRFTGAEWALGGMALRRFCELTCANEIEIAQGNPAFVARHGSQLGDLFVRMRPWLSDGAREATFLFPGVDRSHKLVVTGHGPAD